MLVLSKSLCLQEGPNAFNRWFGLRDLWECLEDVRHAGPDFEVCLHTMALCVGDKASGIIQQNFIFSDLHIERWQAGEVCVDG